MRKLDPATADAFAVVAPTTVDPVVVEAALRIILAPGQVTELRALEAVTADDRRPHTFGGYFDDPAALAKSALRIKSAKGIYFVPNPIKPALLARAMNRARAVGKEPTTSDHDIERRAWLLIDCDAVRPAGVSASDVEHDAAIAKAGLIRATLSDEGWPDPIFADSGNGGHLLYRVDLPTDDGGLAQRCLLALVSRFDDPVVKIDTGVFNPARIWKLYGTLAAKGDAAAARIGRPQRLAATIDTPQSLTIVRRELLDALAAEAPPATTPKPATSTRNGRHTAAEFDVVAWLAQHRIETAKSKPYRGGELWELAACPFNPDHTGGCAHVSRAADGKLGFACKHASCQGKGWRELRDLYEPDRQRHAGNGHAERRRKIDAEVDAGLYGAAAAPDVDAATRDSRAEAREQRITTLERITTRDLLQNSPRPTWIIEHVFVDQQPAGILGSFKTLKTSLAADAVISLATATPFLGHFAVPRALRVGAVSGESGRHTLSLLVRRIAEARGIDPFTLDNLIWSTEIPNLTKAIDLERLRKFIVDDALEACSLDPQYLLLAGAAKDAANAYAMGDVLRGLTQVGADTRCTFLLVHHTSRGASRARGFDPPELGDSAFAGTAEYLRQWVCLGRRSAYQPDSGRHELWVSIGGSAGQSGLYAVDVDEGRLGVDFEGRVWQVQVMRPDEAREERATAEERAKAATAAERLARDTEAVMRAFARFPEGETKTAARAATTLSGSRFNAAVAALVNNGELIQVRVRKHTRPETGFILADFDGARTARTGVPGSQSVRAPGGGGRTAAPIGGCPSTHHHHRDSPPGQIAEGLSGHTEEP